MKITLEQIRAARQAVQAKKLVHQHWQVRKGVQMAPTVTLERRAS